MSDNRKRFIKIGMMILILICFLGFSGCKSDDASEKGTVKTSTQEVEPESRDTAKIVSSEGIQSKAVIEKNDSKPLSSGAVDVTPKEPSEEKAFTKPEETKGTETQNYSVKLKGSGLGEEVVISEGDIRKMATESYTYSFRNKEKDNARQFTTFIGVPITTLLAEGGWDNSSDVMRIICSDGYSNRYKISEINNLYTYQDGSEKPGEKVPAILAVLEEGSYMGNGLYYHYSEGSPFRLIYGQEDYDSDFTKDFNMQGWGYYVSELAIEKK